MLAFVCIACALAAAPLLVWPELRRAIQQTSGEETSIAGAAGMRGAVGPVVAVRDGEAWVEVRGERWKVAGDTTLAVGDRVRVLAVENLELRIAPADEPAAPPEPAALFPPSRLAGLALWALAAALAPTALAVPASTVALGVPIAAFAILAIPGGIDL